MKIKRVRLIYFSATNTTQTVVRRIGAKLSECLDVPVQENDFTLPKAREQDILCQSEELAVVGVPVYAGRVPNKLLPYVRDAIHGSDTLAVPVVLYGNRDYDDALIELRDVLESNGFRTIAGAAFVGEHSFSRILAAGRPDAADLQLADSFAERIADKLQALRELPTEPVSVKGNTPYKPYFAPKNAKEYLKVKPVVSDACTAAGCAPSCARSARLMRTMSNTMSVRASNAALVSKNVRSRRDFLTTRFICITNASWNRSFSAARRQICFYNTATNFRGEILRKFSAFWRDFTYILRWNMAESAAGLL